MKSSSYPGQLNLCNKQRIFHWNSYSTDKVLFWQPVCSVLFNPGAVSSLLQVWSSIQTKAWKTCPQQHVRIILAASLYLHWSVLKCKEDQIPWYVFQRTEVTFPWSSLAVCVWRLCLFYSIICIIITSIQYHTIQLSCTPDFLSMMLS